MTQLYPGFFDPPEAHPSWTFHPWTKWTTRSGKPLEAIDVLMCPLIARLMVVKCGGKSLTEFTLEGICFDLFFVDVRRAVSPLVSPCLAGFAFFEVLTSLPPNWLPDAVSLQILSPRCFETS